MHAWVCNDDDNKCKDIAKSTGKYEGKGMNDKEETETSNDGKRNWEFALLLCLKKLKALSSFRLSHSRRID